MRERPYGIRVIALGMIGACLATASAEPVYGPLNNPEDQWRHVTLASVTNLNRLADAGFNLVRKSQRPTWSFAKDCFWAKDLENTMSRFSNCCENAANCGLVVSPIFAYTGSADAKKLYPRRNLDGTAPKRAAIDAADPRYWEGLRKAMAADAAWMKAFPAYGFAQLATEMRDHIGPSFSPALTNAYRVATGRDIPPEAIGRNPVPWQKLTDFPKDRIVSDDWPVLEFYRWVWTDGDGWRGAMDEMAVALEKALGRKIPMMFNPALRQLPMKGCIGDRMTVLGSWIYPTPEPGRILYPIDQLQAVGRTVPGAELHIGVQGIMYRSYTSPICTHPKDEPAWASEFPKARYITTAPDLFEEALWLCFSRRLDGISTHHEDSLIDINDHSRDGYQCTDPSILKRIGKVFHEVGIPLGPLFRAVPERTPEVAVLESVASMVLGGHIGWAPGEYFSNTMFIINLANISPYVIYEDEIRDRGIPETVKVVVLPKCDVLTRSTYERLVAFQKRGGRLVGDGMLLPALRPDATFVTIEEEGKNTHGDFDNGQTGHFVDSEVRQSTIRGAARKMKAAVGVEPYADSDRDDILVHTRTSGTADYVFAVNDRRTAGDYIGPWRMVLEKGLPNAGVVTVKRTAGAVYDLVRHIPVPFESKDGVTRIPVTYDTNDGRALMVVDAPLKSLSFTVEGSKLTVTSPDRAAMIPIRVDGFGAKPWYAVIRDGLWSRDFGVMGREVVVTNLADGRQIGNCGEK